ncbi:MAG TPA: AMP-binding protein [Terracidiphilus sp.]|nr:AMP-binding protein [Terracidiphilus sp.]
MVTLAESDPIEEIAHAARREDEGAMQESLATLIDDFRRLDRGIAVVHHRGNRRRVTTYAEIARLAGRFAALLERRGVGPGDRVVLWAENSAEWVAAFFGMMLRGVLAVPLDAFGAVEFAARVTAEVKPKLAVGDAALMRQLTRRLKTTIPTLSAKNGRKDGAPTRETPDELETLTFEEWASSLPAEEAGPVANLSRETPLQILFTSGTTGDPKGIVHTHGNVLASVGPIKEGARPYMRWEKLVHPLRFLHTLPLSHVFGQTMGLWVPAIFAAEVHFENRLVASRLVETIKRERISVLAAVPRVIALIKTHLEATRPGLQARLEAAKDVKAWTRWWRFRDVHAAFGLKFWALVSGGGALAGPLEEFWKGLGIVVVQGYGMTETTALITLNHPFHVAQGTIGKPLPGREVKIGADGEVLVKGPMISRATWTGGALKVHEEEWLATGDLAERQETGELKFLGRKSETIVTAAGVNVHPEDVEAALEQEPAVAACAVVAIETANGPEPCAVLAFRGAEGNAAKVVEHANAQLAEFQRVRRWRVWPEPDLPRTSTGKVKRKAVAAWAADGKPERNGAAAGGDWLVALIAEIVGEAAPGADDASRLSEELHLDSLGRVQLAAALEERLGEVPAEGELDRAETLGELRRLLGAAALSGATAEAARRDEAWQAAQTDATGTSSAESIAAALHAASFSHEEKNVSAVAAGATPKAEEKEHYLYPHWPWSWPVAWARNSFQELIARSLVGFLAKPKISAIPRGLENAAPMLIVCNHVTAYDGPLLQYALPGRVRRRVAAAMAGEMLEDYRHFRNPEGAPGTRRFMLFGPLAYVLVTALFNVFPLPRRRDFQRSFAHAGEALDRGYHVLVFPEGTRSAAGELARFRPGIGLLVKQSQTAVLPVALRGLGELKAERRGWFRSGRIEVRVGEPLHFAPEDAETAIAEQLHAEVNRLLKS